MEVFNRDMYKIWEDVNDIIIVITYLMEMLAMQTFFLMM